jgi:ribosomal protein S18 acetylase RimI-like enzyme
LNIEQLSKELKHPSSEFLLNDEVVGYLVKQWRGSNRATRLQCAEIHRIYVLQTYHGKNIGQQLLDFALQMGHHKRASYIWLGVWEENHRALKFYKWIY